MWITLLKENHYLELFKFLTVLFNVRSLAMLDFLQYQILKNTSIIKSKGPLLIRNSNKKKLVTSDHNGI